MQAHELTSLADAPGTAREYETIYILRPNTSNESVGDINERIRKVIEGMGGTVIQVDNWGKRRLAYEVQSERKGIYLYWQYLATHGVVAELERNLRMLDAAIRYMTIKIDSDVDPGARPIEIDDEMYERAATTAADEEDLYLTRGEGGEEGEAGEAGDGDASAKAAAPDADAAAPTDAAAAPTDAAAAPTDAAAAPTDAAAAPTDAAAAPTDAAAAPTDAAAAAPTDAAAAPTEAAATRPADDGEAAAAADADAKPADSEE